MGIARNAALLVGTVLVLIGCTGLVSEKPIFAASDYDTTGALIGQYMDAEGNEKVAITRGTDGQLVFYGFESSRVKKRGSKEPETVWHQALYAEAAAIALGGGDYALQVSCMALAQGGKTYAPWLGGKGSPWRDFTVYSAIAQDRMQDHYWYSQNFYRSDDKDDLLFDRYGAKEPKDGGSVRILPPDMTRSAAAAMFRDLIALAMTEGGGVQLYKRLNREGVLDDAETAALVVKDSATCRRLQREGDPPPDK